MMINLVLKRTLVVWAAWFAGLLTSCTGLGAQQASEDFIAFVDVSVIPMDREVVLEHHTVVISGDRIRDVGPVGDVSIPSGTRLIPGEGKFVMPGLMDMHVHLWPEGDLLVYVANGVTTVRSMFGSPEHLEWREEIRRGDRFGPTIYTTGPILDGEPAYWPGSVVVTTPEEAERVVGEQREAGYDGVKVYDNLLPHVYEAIVAAAGKHDIPVYGHTPLRVELYRALGGGQRSFEHMMDFVYGLLPEDSSIRSGIIDGFAGKVEDKSQALFVTPYENADERRMPALVAEAVRTGAWICPTLVVAQRAARDSVEAETLWEHPAVAYVAPEVKAYWKNQDARFRSERVDLAGMKRGVDLEFRFAAALHRAGAKLILGTDAPNPFVFPGLSVHDELYNLVEAGFSPYKALRAATADAAEFLGSANDVGIIAQGMRADLIVLEANPLHDIKATQTLKGVMVGGQWHPDVDLATRLGELAVRYERATSGGSQD